MKRPAARLLILILSLMAVGPFAVGAGETGRGGKTPQSIADIINDEAPPDRSKNYYMPKKAPLPIDQETAAGKDLTIVVNKKRLIMKSHGTLLLSIPVSLGRPGHLTVRGCYQPYGWHKDHKSSLYPPPDGGAPMNNAVFFYPAQAIHEGDTGTLSHGCVHVSAKNSETIYNRIVKEYGIENTSVCIN